MIDGCLIHPRNAGYQPTNRSTINGKGTGRLRYHALGCKVDGGRGLPARTCLKCEDTVQDSSFRSHMRIDRRVQL